MRAHFSAASSENHFFVLEINAPIADVLIAKLMYCSENDEDDADKFNEAATGDANTLDAV